MTEQTTDTATEATEVTAAAAASLSLNDLALMANIIQVTSERGAIKAQEMTAVGALYSKLVNFINANLPAEGETEEETTDSEAPAED